MESGEVIILIFGQELWFGNKMEEFLIIPNQGRAFGIPICDDPTNQHRTLGIEAYFNTHIPMSMVGSTCGFIIWYPIYDKIDTCSHITISNKHDFYPSKHILKIYSMEEEQLSNVFNFRLINQVSSQKPCASPITRIQDDMSIHEFDRAMVNLSIILDQDRMVDRLIGNIRLYLAIWIFKNYKLNAQLGNTVTVDKEVENRFGKGKRGV